MFASKDIGSRKVFQKPNILRRKPAKKRGTPKVVLHEDNFVNRVQITGNPSGKSVHLMNQAADIHSLCFDKISWEIVDGIKRQKFIENKSKTADELQEIATNSSEIEQTNSQSEQKFFVIRKANLLGEETQCNEEEPSSINIESFLVNSPTRKNATPNVTQTTGKNMETDLENTWCLNFMSDDSKDMVMPNFYDAAQLRIFNEENDKNTKLVSFPNEVSSQDSPNVSEQEIIIQSCLNSRVVKYKCDVPNCNKSFWNEPRLQKHKLIHNKQKTPNTPGLIECPVKKVNSDGVEQQCGHIFMSRETLVKHLNEDHVPEDAAYQCDECGRRFWWATGMRTHAQSTCTRALVCPWPGCGRVFRQPCRLREHARAHNGDRPYPCTYPNCGWAFRSASKLVRHARRHTGERRHECTACGRAFPRREHLRDHVARNHAPRPPHHCTEQGCEETFASTNSLCMHLKKVHNVENKKTAAPKKPAAAKKPAAPKKPASPKKVATPKTPKKVAKSAPQKTKDEVEVLEDIVTQNTGMEAKVPEIKNMLVMTLDGCALKKYGLGDPSFALSDVIETANATAIIKRETQDMHIPLTEVANGHGQVIVKQEIPVTHSLASGTSIVSPAVSPCEYDDLEGKCARTHFTWPLRRAPAETETQSQPDFCIEDDSQVEQCESSESNIYTVRSDLFLHGNVLINEDSEFIIRESSNRAIEPEETSNAGRLDDLDLIDAHPTIDLMPDELYDVAGDESSFRVFMMNPEELS